MHKLSLYIAILITTALFTSIQSSAEAIAELAVLDGLRTQGGSVKINTRIEVYRNDVLESQSILDVYVGTENRSLAVYRSEREAGQKVLMIDDQFWLFLPSSKRAMRITAMQKIMGEASIGDIASLQWQQDYKLISRNVKQDTIVLELAAARKGLSYKTVILWVSKGNFHPIKADFFLNSGKLAKQATFLLEKPVNGQWFMQSLSLTDKVKNNQRTVIYYDNIVSIDPLDKWFTPSFLIRETP